MTLTDQQTADLTAAKDLTAQAKAMYDNARAIREADIRRIAAEGGTYREIAAVAGVAYQRVAQIVTGDDPPTRDFYDYLQFECPRCGAQPGQICAGKARFQSHIERDHIAYEVFREQHPELG